MTRRLLAVLAAGVLTVAPAALHAQSTSLLVSGGLSWPTSDLSNGVNSGYNLNVGVNFGAPIVPVGARIEGGFSSFDSKGGGGTVRIASGTANAIFNLGPTSASPYLIGGLGIYNIRDQVNTVTGTLTTDKSKAGINVGGGFRFPLTGITPFVEARYHVMLGDKSDGTNAQFIPISVGIQF